MPSERAVAHSDSAWRVLALRLALGGEHCGWFKDWYARTLDAERASVWEEAAEIIETMWPGHKTLGVPHSLAESFRARAAALRSDQP